MPPSPTQRSRGLRVTSSLHGAVQPNGIYYPANLRIEVDGAAWGLDYDLTLHVAVIHGDPICQSLEVRQRPEGPRVGRAALGKIPVDRLVREGLASHALTRTPGDNRLTPPTGPETAEIAESLRPRRGPKSNPEAKQQLVVKVADMYLALVEAGESHPKPQIARALRYSTSHVGTLLAEARRQGLVGAATEKGRASGTRPRA